MFRDASHKDKEVYFGLKREYMEYDDVFSTVITEVRQELAQHGHAAALVHDHAAFQPAQER